MTRSDHLVTVDELCDSLATSRLLDVRWRLGDAPGDGRRRYAEGHLPGARFLDLEEVLTSHTDDPLEGRHPLPDAASLAQDLGALGVRTDDDLVVYDEPGSFAAERAWWVLRWAGLRARVLDGGIDAWVATGRPLETGEPPASTPTPTPTRLDITVGQLPTIDVEAAAGFAADGVIVDARAGERYRGEVEPLDPRPGHIPGAVNVSAAALYEDGRMPSDDRLRELLEPALGPAHGPAQRPALDPATPVAAYCGSGVSAARDVLALAVLGIDAALFPGSWSAWSNDPQRPAAVGAQPGQPTVDRGP